MKKKLLLLLCLLVTMGASGKVKSGTFSTGGTWRLDTETGELYIDAETVPNYHMWENTKKHHEWFLGIAGVVMCDDEETYYKTNAPWWEYRADIVSIRFSSKVKTIGTWAFAGLHYNKYKWDKEAAKASYEYHDSYRNGKYKGWYVDKSYGLQRVTFDGNTPVKILDGAFENSEMLNEFDFHSVQEIGDHAFEGTPVLNTHFPALEYMHPDAFDLIKATEMYKRGIVLDKEMDFLMETCMVNFAKNVWEYQYKYYGENLDPMDITVPYELYLDDEVKFNGLMTRLKGSHINLPIGSNGWSWDSQSKHFQLFETKNFDSPEDRPWHGLRNQITKVTLHQAPGKNCFNGCTNLEVVQVTSMSGDIKYRGGLDYIYPIGEKAFYGCTKLRSYGTQSLSNKSIYDYPSIIGDDAFNGCTKFYFNQGLKYAKQIGARAFSGCDFGRIDLDDIEFIGSKAFENGIQTEGRIYMNCSRPETASDAFSGVAGTVTLFIPAKYGDEYAVAPWNKFKLNKQLPDFPIKDGVWSLSSEGTLKVEQVNKGFEKPEDAPWYAYREYVRDIIVDAGIEIGDYAFCDMANVRSVSVPRTCTTIGKCAFKGCSKLVNIYLYKIQKIGDQAFEGCSALEAVELGSDITNMGDYVFRGCVNLNTIENMTKEPGVATANTFAAIGSTAYAAPQHRARAARTAKDVLCTVPEQSLTKYLVADGWKSLAYACDGERGNIIGSGRYYDGYWVIYEDGTLIASSDTKEGEVDFFSPRDAVKRIEFKGNSDELGISTFSNFPNLEEVVLGERVKNIGSEYFKNCTKLKSINLENVDTIGVRCFLGCTALEKVDLKKADLVDSNAFEGCTSLADVTLYGNGGKIGYYTFKDCTSLKSIDMSGINYAASGVFEGCSALESVIFRGQALQVYSNMFKNCTALKSLDVSDDCWSINASSLAGTGISRIYSASPKPPTINETAFGDRALTSITAYVPADYMNAYRKAPVWRNMNFAIDERYGEPQLPTGGLVGEKGTWELDELGVLTIDCEGKMPASDQYLGADAANNRSWYSTFDRWAAFIENVRYTDNVTYIPQNVTDGEAEEGTYHSVKTVEIGCNVDTIQANAMRYTGLTDVYCFAPEPPFIVTSDENGTFDKAAILARGTTLHVVDFQGTLEKYKNSYRWNWFPKIVADLPTRKPGTIMVEKVNVSSPTGTWLSVRSSELGSTTVQLEANVYPANADNTAVVWTSEDETKASVDANGLVTIIGYPDMMEVGITATAADGSNRKGTVNLRIVNPENDWGSVLCEGMDVDRKTITIMKSQAPATITVKLEPANSTANIDFDVVDNSLIQVEAEYDDATGRRTGVFRISAPDPMMMPEIRTGSTQIHFYTHYYDEEKLGTEYPQVWVNVNVIEDVRFTEETVQNVPVTYAVTSFDGGTCTVYGEWVDGHDENGTWVDGGYNTAIDQGTTGLVTVPNKARNYYVTGVDGSAFADCSQLEEVEFESGIKFIGNSAFTGCSNLREVLLPETIEAFGYSCFSNLPSLKDVHILATTPPTGGGIYVGNPWPWPAVGDSYAFSGLTGATLHVPAGCKEAYNVSPWTEWFTTIQEDAVTAVDEVTTSKPSVPDVWYTLDGIRISKPTKAGIYIKGGRKYIVK